MALMAPNFQWHQNNQRWLATICKGPWQPSLLPLRSMDGNAKKGYLSQHELIQPVKFLMGLTQRWDRGNELKTYYKLCHVRRYDLGGVHVLWYGCTIFLRVTTTKLILKPKWIKLKNKKFTPRVSLYIGQNTLQITYLNCFVDHFGRTIYKLTATLQMWGVWWHLSTSKNL